MDFIGSSVLRRARILYSFFACCHLFRFVFFTFCFIRITFCCPWKFICQSAFCRCFIFCSISARFFFFFLLIFVYALFTCNHVTLIFSDFEFVVVFTFYFFNSIHFDLILLFVLAAVDFVSFVFLFSSFLLCFRANDSEYC